MIYNNIFDSLGIVSIIIGSIALLSIFFFIERLTYINKITLDTAGFVDGIINLLKNNKRNEALTLCEETLGPIASIIRTCILCENNTIKNIETKISALSTLDINTISKRLDLLKYLGFSSSCFGLIGTLVSISNNFDNLINNNLILEPKVLLAFFTYSINTTIFGFFTAFIVFIMHTFLAYKIKLLIFDMQWSTHKVCEFLFYSK